MGLFVGVGHLSQRLEDEAARVDATAGEHLHAGDGLHHQHRVAAQVEEVVIGPDVVGAQQVGPDAGQRGFHRTRIFGGQRRFGRGHAICGGIRGRGSLGLYAVTLLGGRCRSGRRHGCRRVGGCRGLGSRDHFTSGCVPGTDSFPGRSGSRGGRAGRRFLDADLFTEAGLVHGCSR